MTGEIVEFQDVQRKTRQAIIHDLAQRAVDIVTVYHPKPVLGAEIEAQITETTPYVETAGNRPLDVAVEVSSAVALALGHAVNNRVLQHDMRGNQPRYRLPADPIEAGHITL